MERKIDVLQELFTIIPHSFLPTTLQLHLSHNVVPKRCHLLAFSHLPSSSHAPFYLFFLPSNNLTEALLFLSHFMGDIHQPLHVGFASDKGGNTIEVHWYKRKANLHHIWDSNIIETAEEDLYNAELEGMVDAIKKKITTEWADQVKIWESCTKKTACPDIYASEGNKAACDWAYKGVTEGDTLQDEYFYSRLPIVYERLAQGGVRLAATLNKIFG